MNNPPNNSLNVRSAIWKLAAVPYLLFILIPVVALLVRASPSDILLNLKNDQIHQAIQLSIITSLVTVLLTVCFGTPVAYYLSHPHYRLHGIVDTLVDLPTLLPPAVAGVALLMAFGRRGVGGSLL